MRPPRMETAARTAQERARTAPRHDAFGGCFEPLGEPRAGDVLTEMHRAPAQAAYERISSTDHPARANSMAYALERVFKVGP